MNQRFKTKSSIDWRVCPAEGTVKHILTEWDIEYDVVVRQWWNENNGHYIVLNGETRYQLDFNLWYIIWMLWQTRSLYCFQLFGTPYQTICGALMSNFIRWIVIHRHHHLCLRKTIASHISIECHRILWIGHEQWSMKWELCEPKRANMYFAISRVVSHCVEHSSVPRNYLRTRMWIEWMNHYDELTSQSSVWRPSWTLAIDGIDFWKIIVRLSLG